jgi:integrase
MPMKFTATTTKHLRLPAGSRELIAFDDDTPGFGLRLRKSGARSWIVQYKLGAQNRRLTLGSTDLLDFTRARASARDVLAKVRLGEDPQSQKQQARITASETFGKYIDAYLEWKRAAVRPASFREITRHLQVYAKSWHTRPLSSITVRDAAVLVDGIAEKRGAPSANRAKASFSPYFGWLRSKGLIENNPFLFLPKQTENGSRERVLSDAELAAIWHAAGTGGDQFGTLVRVLILTGARRAEIGDLVWDEFVDDMVTIPAKRSKNRRDHEILLSAPARALLESRPRRNSTNFLFGQRDGAGFSGWSKAKKALDKRLADAGIRLAPWSLHDIRRTVATGLAERLGTEPHIVESVLGHVSGFLAGVAGTYNRALYRGPKAEAMQRWGDYVLALTVDHKANEPERRTAPARSTSSHEVRHGRRSRAEA